jgi:N-sulfoglucosamine sulfohydrolase
MKKYAIALIATLSLFLTLSCQAADRPNFLIIMADDCNYSDLPIFGGENAKTPNIDRLASEGLVFNRAYLSEAMCQPCRAELFTGQFPLRNGCAWNHSASRPQTQSVPHHLKPLGYRVGLAGKVHVKPAPAFPFEKIAGFDPNCVRNPTNEHELLAVKQFFTRNPTQPFYLTIALVEPHVPWVMGDPTQYPQDQIKLPPNIADTPTTREAFSRYLAEITYMDTQVGDILQALDDSGQRENTVVLFTSEQGAQFPGCKWTNWDTGLHTALIARWPGHVVKNKRTDAIVQYADILPTFLDAAGSDTPTHPFDGSSFLSVLLGEQSTHRLYAYGIHNNLPEGPPYPIRTVTNGEYRYLRNLKPDEFYIEKHLMGWTGEGQLNNPYWQTWVRDAWKDSHTYDLVKRYMHRPAIQLYHTAKDPYELTNLADSPEHAWIRELLSDELDQWMITQGDPGTPEDTTDALEAARRGQHLFFPTP